MAVLSSAISSEPVADWSTLLCKYQLFNNGSLDFHPPEVLGSVKVVNILADDVSSTTNKWNCALIAQFPGSDSSLDAVKKFAETKWNDFGLLEVQKLDNELFVFRFRSEESKIKVLEEPLVSYGSEKMMFLRPWVPNKPIQKLTLRTVPIWIKLPGLGLQYFSLKALSKLGSLVGRPLFVDKVTADQSRLAYARMCVEIKADEELPNEIIFLNEFGVEILQKVEYEWIPPRCTFCNIFGHNTNICTKNSRPDSGKAKGDSHDMKSEQPGLNADSEKVDQKASCKDEVGSQEKSLLPEEKACPCGSKKNYNACCGSVSGRSSCKDEGRSEEKKGMLHEEKKISRNKSCPCGSKKKYKACCKPVSGRSSCEDGGGSQEKKRLLYEDKVEVNDLRPRPGTYGHTLTVKVVSSNSVINIRSHGHTQTTSAGLFSTRPRVAECLVGDETGTIVFTARNEQVDLMKADATVILHNAKIDMFKGYMRLAVDKWGRIEVTEPANFAVKGDNNLSLVEYEVQDVAE